MTITGTSGKARGLGYTFADGRFGTLTESDEGSFRDGALQLRFAPCAEGALTLDRPGQTARGVQLRLIIREVSFVSDGVTLHGKLLLPQGGKADNLAAWIEGSNNDPSTDDTIWQYELARRGIAAFVYDKRGTGASGGALSSDFAVRARDTVAALATAKRLAPGVTRFGVIGGSQGGWVAPLAASLTRLDFVIPAFAMAESPIAQDRELVELQLRAAGFGAAELALAQELTTITARIARSDMRDGLAELDAFKARHTGAPWLQAIAPRSFTGLFLLFPTAEIKANGPALAQGLRFDFDPLPLIARLKSRQLWLLAGSDTQAPNAATQTILRRLQRQRRDIAVVVFPRADHGLIEPVAAAEGRGRRYARGVFDITADWIADRRLPGPAPFVVMPVAAEPAPLPAGAAPGDDDRKAKN